MTAKTKNVRLLDWQQLKLIVPYSRVHVGRLEAAGRFPRRLLIGDNRIGWRSDEIDLWIESLQRAKPPSPARARKHPETIAAE
jgi:prophage regulatory protein